MVRRKVAGARAMFVVGVFLLGCAGSQGRGKGRSNKGVEKSCGDCTGAPSQETEPLPLDEGSPQSDCSHVVPADSLQVDFEKGKEFVTSCDEMCLKGGEGGAQRAEGLTLLKTAAEKGHLAAQAFYGRTKFTDLMTTGFEPALEAEYIEAMYYLALASQRGTTTDLLPQLSTLTLDAKGEFSEPLTEPLSHLDEGWVKAALVKARDELRCFSK